MYAVTVTFRIKSGKMEIFLPLMVNNARASCDREPGCQMFDVCRDEDTVFLKEVYDDRAAFDAHLASDHFREFDGAVADMIEDKQIRLFTEVIR